jgi:predicted DNA-binding protein (MmcQ/YjbR family)
MEWNTVVGCAEAEAVMTRPQVRDADWDEALSRLRALCGELPGVAETTAWGNPTFKVGRKAFAVLDAYQGASCVWLLCGAERRAALLAEPGFFPAPYDRAGAAVCRRAATIDWAAFAPLLRESYERALGG